MAVIVSVLAVLLTVAAPSPVWKPQLISAEYGRNIRELPCVSRRTGETGVCMFAYACMKANGTHLGTCIDRFYFGSCCRLNDNLPPSLAFQPVQEDDNAVNAQVSTYDPDGYPATITDTTTTTTTPTATTTSQTSTSAKPIVNSTKKPSISSTKKPSVTTARPSTTTKKGTTTGRPITKPKPSATTTRRPPTKKPAGKPPSLKPTSPKPPYSSSAKPNPKPTTTSKPVHLTTTEVPHTTASEPTSTNRTVQTAVNDSSDIPNATEAAGHTTSISPLTEATSGASLVTWTVIENANSASPAGAEECSGDGGNTTPSDWVQVTVSAPINASSTTVPPVGNSSSTSIPVTTSATSTLTTTTVGQDDFTGNLSAADYREVCGRRLVPDGRIVGGQKSSFGKWPWQISLRQWRTATYLHKCGAALLNENWAITAAHCVENVPPSDLLLRLGEHDLSTEDEPYGFQERRVQIVASHPQFDPRTFEYDLALLRFYEPVTFQPNIVPICVPNDDRSFVGHTAHVTGWGRLYEDGPLPSVLQEVSVPVINNTLCESMYRSAGYIEHIPEIFICAGWKKGGFDSCEGDSGGPMVIQREDKRWLLAGVISWGIGCAEPNQPGVYTRISEFREWINQILQF